MCSKFSCVHTSHDLCAHARSLDGTLDQTEEIFYTRLVIYCCLYLYDNILMLVTYKQIATVLTHITGVCTKYMLAVS